MLEVRNARKEDMGELANFEKGADAVDAVKISVQDLISNGFETNCPWFFAIVAEENDKIIGYALCNQAYSSWLGRSYYIEDIYVLEEFRGLKIGHKIFQNICKRACENNVHRIDWHVLVDNEIARRFYDKHGAYDLCAAEKRTAYRIDKDEINEIASST